MSDNLFMAALNFVIPYAHAGHWLASLLYLVPVFILAGGIIWQRRQDARPAPDSEPPGEDSTD